MTKQMKLFAISFSSYSCTKQLLIHGQNSIWVCYRVNERMSGKSLATFLCEEFCDGDPDDHQESDDDGNSDSQGCDKISQQTADRLYSRVTHFSKSVLNFRASTLYGLQC